jgi:peroxiredoxin
MGWSAPWLYLLSSQGTLRVWDLTSPSNPGEGAQINGLGHAWEMAVVGDAGYVADTQGRLHVLDLSSPASPSRVGSVDLPGAPLDVAAQDGLLAVALGTAGYALLDASDPLDPTLLGVHPQGRHIGSVSFEGSRLWMTTNEDVRAVDVTDPTDPVPVVVRRTPGWARGAAAANGRVLVADWAGVRRFELTDAAAPSLVPDARNVYFAGDDAEQTLTVTNRGAAALCIETITSGDDAVEVTPQNVSLAPGASVALTVTVTPGWDGDTTLTLISDDPAAPEAFVGIRTTGVGQSAVSIGELAPDIVLSNALGGSWSLADHLGSPVVLSFFATWCSFCPEQMIDLDRSLYPRWQEQGVELVGIASGEPAGTVSAYVNEYGLSFPLLLDSDRAVQTAYFQQTDSQQVIYPQDWVIDAEGRIAHLSTHYLPEELQRVVDELLEP